MKSDSLFQDALPSSNICDSVLSDRHMIKMTSEPINTDKTPGQQARRSIILSIARQRKNVRFLELPSQSTDRAFLLCNGAENLGDHIF